MIVIWSGLSVGAIYALTALAYTIVFVPSGTFNFAQAFFVMIGAFLAYTTLVSWHLPWIVAVVVCGVVAGAAWLRRGMDGAAADPRQGHAR